jgi:anti-sigma B factor antagonist
LLAARQSPTIMSAEAGMNPNFIITNFEKWTIVEFRTSTLMDPPILESIQNDLVRLVEEEDRRQVILDFERVQYVSSQAIGIIIQMNKKLKALKHSMLVLCSVPPKIMEVLKILRLDKLLTISPTQHEAVKIRVH